MERQPKATQGNYGNKHNDPAADLTLISLDDMVFKIHSFYLKAHSPVFREMMSEGNTFNDSPIPIDAPSSAVHLFLDLMHGDKPTESINIELLSQVLHLCDTFSCTLLSDSIQVYLQNTPLDSPWVAFCIAARCRNILLAKSAIRRMGSETRKPPGNRWRVDGITPDFAAQCTDMSFLLGFFRAASVGFLKVAGNGYARYCPVFEEVDTYDWDRAADAFEPVESLGSVDMCGATEQVESLDGALTLGPKSVDGI